MKGWTLIYSDNHAPRIALLKQQLEVEGIAVVMLNKQDSSYLFGLQEVYVRSEDAVRALHLINRDAHE